MSLERHQPVTILLVEDNPDHAELTKRALETGNMVNKVVWVKDGEEALDFLYQRGAWASSQRPGLVLLDVNLPKVDGHKVLRQIKDDPRLQSIPVIMLTTSAREDEVGAAYQSGANSWITKPVQFTEFVQTVKAVKLYWVVTNRLPE
jgi:two-component system response regulator